MSREFFGLIINNFINFKLRIMNLQNLNVAELSAQEVQETEGGGWGLVARAVVAAAASALATDAAINYGSTWDAFKAGFKAGEDANPLPN